MTKQWMIRLTAVAMTLFVTACEIGGTTTNTDSSNTYDMGTHTGVIPDSGQTSCYYDYTIIDINGDGIDDVYDPSQSYCVNEYAAWQPYGQDAHYSINPLSYTDNGDGTIHDNVTGLVWQKCSVGETGSDCSGGSIGSYSWSSAQSVCASSNLAGGNWRLPTMTELMSIVDYEESMGTLDGTAFPGTSSPYWTSTPHAYYSSFAWFVNFSQGTITADYKTNLHYARCVRK